ncbi:hypothetical protein WMY93_001908 [Mugilogobius chulae]|uniref:Uncharacterized protein n=1 Tax=Mugilogobius chulae TaxID=88201 RepID=A0AAW0PVM9_9GOBI
MAAVKEPEVQFAQKLASNEKTMRRKALKKLRSYISARSRTNAGFSEEELLKLWKGLFYCLWMQDKLLRQEELSTQISGLLQHFHSFNAQLLFFETFLTTVKREWTGIDRLRMDKYYQLHTSVSGVGSSSLLQADTPPAGLQLHVLDLYLRELAVVGAPELTADQNLIFIEPFMKTAAKTKDRVLFGAICNSIFSTIIDQAPFAIQELLEDTNQEVKRTKHQATAHTNGTKAHFEDDDDLGEDDDDEEDNDGLADMGQPVDEDVGPVLQFDYEAVAAKLLQLSSRENTPSRNRHRLYKIIRVLRDLSQGSFPQDEYPEEVSTDEDDDDFGSRKRMKRMHTQEEEPEEEPEQKTTKGKRKKKTTSETSTESDSTVSSEQDKKCKKKKKTPSGTEPTAEVLSEVLPQVQSQPQEQLSILEPQENDTVTTPKPKKKKRKKAKKVLNELTVEESKAHAEPTPTTAQTQSHEQTPKEEKMTPQAAQDTTTGKRLKKKKVINKAPQNGPTVEESKAHAEPTPTTAQTQSQEQTLKEGKMTPQEGQDTVQKRPKKKKKQKDSAQAQPQEQTLAEVVSQPQRKKKGKAVETAAADETQRDSESPSPMTSVKVGLKRASQPEQEEAMVTEKKRRKKKIPVEFEYEAEEVQMQDSTGKPSDLPQTPLSSRPQKLQRNLREKPDFVSFQSRTCPPPPLFCRALSTFSKSATPKSDSKKVRFGLKNNQTAEFRRTDRSLLLSPDGSSRVPFDPEQKPKCGVLKSPPTPAPKQQQKKKKRATAADFF